MEIVSICTDTISRATIAKGIGIIVLTMFLPLTAWTYYSFRRERGQFEARRILTLLNVQEDYRDLYGWGSDQHDGQGRKQTNQDQVDQPDEKRTDRNRTDNLTKEANQTQKIDHTAIDPTKHEWQFLSVAVLYVSVVTFVGLLLLFFASEIGLPAAEFPHVALGENVLFPKSGSRLIFGMAFLGAYVWGLQYIFQRYALNDLTPSVYYSLAVRMIFASLIAMVIYNATDALALFSGEDPSSGEGLLAKIWPALAFLIGMFPRQGIRWFTERTPFLSSQGNASVRKAPLEMVEGIGSYDSLRLEELGIDTCYDLATADFVPLKLKTPYSARQLIDWILQAKLCACFGEGVKDLRRHGIRTVVDLMHLKEEDIEPLSTETALTKSALRQAREAVIRDKEIRRLYKTGLILGQFAQIDDDTSLP